MMRRAAMLATAGLILATGTAGAQAKGDAVVEAARPDSVVAALQAAGYKAVLERDSAGDPKVTSAASGTQFTIFFYGCESHTACKSLQLYAGYSMKTKPAVGKMNEWNLGNRFGSAFIDKEGDPNLQWDIVTQGGLSARLFGQIVDRWSSAMGGFQTFIGW